VGGNELATVNLNTAGTVTASTGVAATNINFGTAADTTGTLSVAAAQTIEGAVTATTAGEGNVTFAGAGTLTGSIGVVGANEIRLVTVGNGAVTSSGDIAATTINFAGDNSLTMAAGTTLEGAVTTTTDSTGTLTFTAAGTMTGQIGTATNALKDINQAGGIVSFSSSIFADNMDLQNASAVTLTGGFGSSAFTTGVLDFEAAATATVADGQSIYGTVTTSGNGQGNLTFAGTSTVSGAIGTSTLLDLATITHSVAGKTLTFGGNVFATTLTNGAANTIDIGANTMTFTDVTLNATTTLGLTINSATAYGNIATSGTTTIAATNVIDVNVDGSVANGQTFNVIVSTTDGATAPTSVTDNSALLNFTASEAAGTGDVVLTAALNSTGVATTNSSSAVLTSVDNALAGSHTADFTTVTNALYSLSNTAAATAALETLDPIVNAGQNGAGFNQVNQSLGVVSEHLADTRSGVATGDMWKDAGFWGKWFGNTSEQDKRKEVNGYDADMWGVAIGADGLISDVTRLGFAGSYASTDVTNKIDTGSTDIDSYQGTVYLGYDDPSPWYVNGAFAFTWNQYDGSRGIAFGTIDRTAKSDYDGQQYTVSGDAGYVIKSGEFNVTPLGSLVYSHMEIEKYTETGADSLNLTVNAQDYDLLQSGLGVKLDHPYTDNSGTYVPEVHFKWLYDFIGDKAATTATFAGGGSSFSTNGADPAQSSFNLGAGLTFYTKGNITLSAVYDYETKADFDSHSGQATFRYNF
jgi:outer membrane autotransporter protein